MRDYKELVVWQRAHALTIDIRRATKSFPRSGYAALLSQIVRAAESIAMNIVEGCFAASQKDFARFLDISIKSSGEVEYQAATGPRLWDSGTGSVARSHTRNDRSPSYAHRLRKRVSDSHHFPSALPS